MLPTLILLLAIPLAQVESPPSELPSQVRQLVRQLNSRQLSEREAAEKALIALGTDALEFLPRITARTPGEVRDRLSRIQTLLQNKEITASIKSTLVTLKADSMRLSEVLKAFEQQTGNRIIDQRGQRAAQVEDVAVSVEFENTPFWPAIDKLLDQVSMTIYAYGGEEGALAIVASDPAALPRSGDATYSEVFRIEPVRIESARELRQTTGGTLLLTLEVAWEPRLRPIAVEQPFASLVIMGDDGSSLKIAGSDAGRTQAETNAQMSSAEITIPLELPDRSVRKIGLLRGTLETVLPGRMEEFVFDDLTDVKNRRQSKAGVSVLLGRVEEAGELHAVEVIVHFDDAGDSLASHRGWIFENDVHLLSPSGQRVEVAGFEKTQETPSDVGISYKFDLASPLDDGLGDFEDDGLDGGDLEEEADEAVKAEKITLEGYKLIYRTPAGIVHRTFKYELKDIPLP